MNFNRIAVLGGGAWGTALANVTARAGRKVTLWEYDAGNATQLAQQRESKFLPGVRIEDSIAVTCDLAEAARADAILLVVPAQAMRSVVKALGATIALRTPVIACAKGIEHGTHKFMTEVIAECAPNATPAILSGPSFAADVARGLPAALTLATADEALGQTLAIALGYRHLRIYWSSDTIGVQLGGAVKNVLAIAAGIVDGKGLGASAHAALVTRGFAELRRFGEALGARADTLMGLSGLGDLLLTCGSAQSRNMSLGRALGQGQTLASVLGSRRSVAEGVYTAAAVAKVAADKGVDMPICQAVSAIVAGKLTVDAAIEGLLSRPQRAET